MAIRILIIDDSSTIRQLLVEIFRGEEDLKVIGWAGNGIDGLAKIRELKPDVVIMDVEMPLLGGVETLAELMETTPVPVIMFSSHTPKGASTTLMALDLGAVDVIEKPSCVADWEIIHRNIIPAVRAAAGANLARKTSFSKDLPRLQPSAFDLIAIGCSTGGPAALSRMLPLLPAPFPLPVVVAQHMPEVFLEAMTARLRRYCSVEVQLAAEGIPVRANCIWVSPGNTQTTVVNRRGELVFRVGQCSTYKGLYQPSVDMLLASAAEICGSRTLAFVLTGMGKDGLAGAARLHKAGGTIITQDKDSCVIYGMPGSICNAGLATWELPLEDIGSLLRSFGR